MDPEISAYQNYNSSGYSDAERADACKRIVEIMKAGEAKAADARAEATKIADEYGLYIYYAPTGYGSGQTYHPKGEDFDSSGCSDDFDSSGCSIDAPEEPTSGHWLSSSESC